MRRTVCITAPLPYPPTAPPSQFPSSRLPPVQQSRPPDDHAGHRPVEAEDHHQGRQTGAGDVVEPPHVGEEERGPGQPAPAERPPGGATGGHHDQPGDEPDPREVELAERRERQAEEGGGQEQEQGFPVPPQNERLGRDRLGRPGAAVGDRRGLDHEPFYGQAAPARRQGHRGFTRETRRHRGQLDPDATSSVAWQRATTHWRGEPRVRSLPRVKCLGTAAALPKSLALRRPDARLDTRCLERMCRNGQTPAERPGCPGGFRPPHPPPIYLGASPAANVTPIWSGGVGATRITTALNDGILLCSQCLSDPGRRRFVAGLGDERQPSSGPVGSNG